MAFHQFFQQVHGFESRFFLLLVSHIVPGHRNLHIKALRINAWENFLQLLRCAQGLARLNAKKKEQQFVSELAEREANRRAGLAPEVFVCKIQRKHTDTELNCFYLRLSAFDCVFVFVQALPDGVGVRNFAIVNKCDILDAPADQAPGHLAPQRASANQQALCFFDLFEIEFWQDSPLHQLYVQINGILGNRLLIHEALQVNALNVLSKLVTQEIWLRLLFVSVDYLSFWGSGE